MTMAEPVVLTSDPETEEVDDGFCHIVRKGDVIRGYVGGAPIKALCGRVFVPSRDPNALPVCPICERTKGHLGRSNGN